MSPSSAGFLCPPFIINLLYFLFLYNFSFNNTKVSDENSSISKTFHFLNLFQLKTFVHPTYTIQSHILKFQPFLTKFAIFHAFNDLF